jgi:hypothetical protein
MILMSSSINMNMCAVNGNDIVNDLLEGLQMTVIQSSLIHFELHEIQPITEIIMWVTHVNDVVTDILNQLQLTAKTIATYVNNVATDVF